MFSRTKPSASMVVAVIAVVFALGGVSAAATGLTDGATIKPGTVRHLQLAMHSVGTNNLTRSLQTAINRKTRVTLPGQSGIPGSSGSQGSQGSQGSTGDTGVKGDPGAKGDTGATGPRGPALFESIQSCAPDLCIDAAPGPDGSAGSGGWGYDTAANKPVTNLEVGSTNPLTVTVLQPNNETANGTITLTYDPYDFTYTGVHGDSGATCVNHLGDGNPYPAVTCTYTDLAHSAKSDAFQFKANHDNPNATMTATVSVGGEQASAQFPVAITG